MYMVWHNNTFIQGCVDEMLRNIFPAVLNTYAPITNHHFAINDFTKRGIRAFAQIVTKYAPGCE